ncbi:MAG: LysR family transcriptional regulator [Burkholderiales bacterium]|nr:LysR family transcriptional regulator [Burkholderiales bacterium]
MVNVATSGEQPRPPGVRGDGMMLHQLRALVTVANAGGIRGAARALGVLPASITKSLHQLEAHAQAPLLLPTSGGVTLTEIGQALLVHARLRGAQMARAQEAIESMRGSARGKVALAVTP